MVVAIFVGMNKKVLPQAGGVLGAGAKTNGEVRGGSFLSFRVCVSCVVWVNHVWVSLHHIIPTNQPKHPNKHRRQELGQLFGQRGHKVEALHRVLQRFDDPTAAPEALGLKLTLVLSHREAALRPFALQDEQPASKAERDLYAQHKEDYRAQLQQQQQQPVQSGLRRSSRAATRASSAAAGRGGGAEVSIVEDAKVCM